MRRVSKLYPLTDDEARFIGEKMWGARHPDHPYRPPFEEAAAGHRTHAILCAQIAVRHYLELTAKKQKRKAKP